MSYEPRPGTVAFRALAYLETQPPGTEMLTSQLAEAIGAEVTQIQACLQPANEAGLVFFRKRDDHARSPRWWSLTDRSALPKSTAPAAIPVEAPARRDIVLDLKKGAEHPSHGDRLSIQRPAPRIEDGPVTKDEHGFRACLWTNGVLQIEREPGDLVLIAPPHVEAIRKLLTGGIA